ncbi:MAG: hypothetical protein LBJ19_00595 [Holosporaceae bacterium]|nr:hypothetical protein [Holosporaceae bacterium]
MIKTYAVTLVVLLSTLCTTAAFAYDPSELAEAIRDISGQLEELKKKVADQQIEIDALRVELKKHKDEQSVRATADIILKKSPEEIIQIAVDEMSSGDTEGARHLLETFIKNNSQSIYVGKMEHYIGNSYFQDHKYKEAATAYLSSYEHNATGSKSAESLHKLAQCLKKMSEAAESEVDRSKLQQNCQTTARKLINDHPNYEQLADVKREFGIP